MARQQNGSDVGGPRFLKYPYAIGGSGIPQTTTSDDHLRDLILQVLLTSPGERMNMPEFGAGVQRLVFEPFSETIRASAEFLISTDLQRWLGDRIDVERVGVTGENADEGTITIEIDYVVKATQQRGSVAVQI
jgi:uncharacterized protein